MTSTAGAPYASATGGSTSAAAHAATVSSARTVSGMAAILPHHR